MIVEAFIRLLQDAGSIPAASTRLRSRLRRELRPGMPVPEAKRWTTPWHAGWVRVRP